MRYSGCKWCGGRGCLYCGTEREKAIKKQENIQPIFTANLTDEKDMELLKSLFGREAIEKAWDEAQGSFDPKAEFSRLLTINGIIGRMTQLQRKARGDDKEVEETTENEPQP